MRLTTLAQRSGASEASVAERSRSRGGPLGALCAVCEVQGTEAAGLRDGWSPRWLGTEMAGHGDGWTLSWLDTRSTFLGRSKRNGAATTYYLQGWDLIVWGCLSGPAAASGEPP